MRPRFCLSAILDMQLVLFVFVRVDLKPYTNRSCLGSCPFFLTGVLLYIGKVYEDGGFPFNNGGFSNKVVYFLRINNVGKD